MTLEELAQERCNTKIYVPPEETLFKLSDEIRDFFWDHCVAITLGRVGGHQIELKDLKEWDYLIIMQTEKGKCIQEDEEHTFLHEFAHAWLLDNNVPDSEDAVNAKVAEWLREYEEGECER